MTITIQQALSTIYATVPGARLLPGSPGLRRMVPWLEQRLPGVPVSFIGTTSAFQRV